MRNHINLITGRRINIISSRINIAARQAVAMLSQ